MLQLLSAILYRLDGWGAGDRFLPFLRWPLWGGINYSRYAIGAIVALFTNCWWYTFTYALAVSLPYGEKSWLRELFDDHWCWFIVGFAYGLASLSWGNAVFCGFLFLSLMHLSNVGIHHSEPWWRERVPENTWWLDHAWCEFIFGGLGVMIFLFK